MAGEIDINTVAKAYARWAPVYDFVFGAVFDAGRKASIAAAGLAAGIPLAAAGAMGRASRRRAPARAPRDAAARTFLADPLRAAGGRERAGPAGRGWRTTLTVRTWTCTMHHGSEFDDLRWKRDLQRATACDVANSCEQEGIAPAAA